STRARMCSSSCRLVAIAVIVTLRFLPGSRRDGLDRLSRERGRNRQAVSGEVAHAQGSERPRPGRAETARLSIQGFATVNPTIESAESRCSRIRAAFARPRRLGDGAGTALAHMRLHEQLAD